jgi:hypoxanthine phosphoribosyltransferase
MKQCTLSLEDVKKDCIELSKLIDKSGFKPECIVYIKSGGYLVGKYISEYFNVPYNGLRISRQGNELKKHLKIILKIIPKYIKNILRVMELKSGYHKKHNERLVTEVDESLVNGTNILLVDDSIDTGNTIISAIKFLHNNYGENLNVKVAALNKFKLSEEVANTDFYLYEDSIIIYPWSKDSAQYDEFLDIYNE